MAFPRHSRATLIQCCRFGLFSNLLMTVRISSSSLSISSLPSSLSATIRLLAMTSPLCRSSTLSCRHNLCKISKWIERREQSNEYFFKKFWTKTQSPSWPCSLLPL
uniref:Uncharacterized protein n=1 Tax=Callorhinchus milii TaxID=7868 RepID=A0A4W3I564_CALMI